MPRGIYKRTEETKRKMSEVHKKIGMSGIKGKHHTEETKKKIEFFLIFFKTQNKNMDYQNEEQNKEIDNRGILMKKLLTIKN